MRQGHHLEPPSLNPCSVALMRLMPAIKPGVKPSSTLRLPTLAAVRAAPRWSELGPQLGEPPILEGLHRKACQRGPKSKLEEQKAEVGHKGAKEQIILFKETSKRRFLEGSR